ncbi:TRIC cation channel family protein [Actinocrinis puniceicyclus]|uniref:TRIC cation channel family protein n=1 Tax=Actinocrinis puniceicyclus TaxID=977794 RepID=A0A8J7WMV7_9ACTN|nr:TRIC cation channel family protein [Actinocrinis puniceicyclus]MBS2963072.1 TRIC cation channel family protein [Actinocrinis puniceicyclus]
MHLPILFDLLGVFSAAASGALTGIRKGLDLVGILVLGAATGLGGGAVRDVLIGAHPPAFLVDWRYLTTATLAALGVVVVEYRLAAVGPLLRERVRLSTAYLTVDSLTLGFFAVSGTGKALRYGLAPVPAALMGVLTAVGGGVIRDMLVAEVPTVLRREFYAIPAALGSVLVAAVDRYTTALTPLAFAAAGLTAALRMVAARRGWHARLSRPPRAEEPR